MMSEKYKILLKNAGSLKKYIIAYFLLIIIFVSSITIVSALPNENILLNTVASVPQFQTEGSQFNPFSDRKSIIYGFTDTLMAGMQYYVEPSTPLKSALVAPLYYYDGLAYYDFYTRPADGNYARYWHGYTVWLRPLLMFCDYAQSRTVLFTVFFFLMLATIICIHERLGKRVTFAFFVSMCSIYFITIPMCWAYISPYIIMFISLIYFSKAFKDDSFIKKIPLCFFIIGSFQCFLDLMSVPLITYGMPAVIIFLIIRKNNYLSSLTEQIKLLFKTGIAWISGYGLIWFAKWVLVDLLYGTSIISDGIKRVFLLVSEEDTYNLSRFNLIRLNIDYMFGNKELNVNALLFVLLFIIWVVLFVICNRNNKFKRRKSKNVLTNGFIPVIFIACLPYLWYIVLFNHSYIHYHLFSYKLQMVTIFAMLSVFLLSINSDRFTNIIRSIKEGLLKRTVDNRNKS